jgi:hypothetical protein
VSRALAATIEQPAQELRQLEAERLDAMTAALWPRAMDGDLRATDRILGIMDRRARLLGLDAPRREAITVVRRDQFMEMINQLEGELRALGEQPVD